jgi:hypothetical protein
LVEKTRIPTFIFGCVDDTAATTSPFLFIFLFATVLAFIWFAVLMTGDFARMLSLPVQIDIDIPAAAVDADTGDGVLMAAVATAAAKGESTLTQPVMLLLAVDAVAAVAAAYFWYCGW